MWQPPVITHSNAIADFHVVSAPCRVSIKRAVGEWRQRLPLAVVLKEDILSTCCNKDDVI